MLPAGVILGYHGCEASIARRAALAEEPLRPSANDYDWLGNGIYFWAHDPQRAQEWIDAKARSKRIKPAVIGAAIELGNCLNLAERAFVAWVAKAYSYLLSSLEKEGQFRLMPANIGKRRHLDNRVIECLHTLRETEGMAPYGTVIGYFAEGQPIYEGAELRHQNHLQICVRNPAKVLGYFYPRIDSRRSAPKDAL